MGFVAASVAAPPDKLLDSLSSYRKPNFPAELRSSPVTDGYATLAIVIRADGTVDDAVVLEASHPSFGDAVLDVLPNWRFKSGDSVASNSLPYREVLRFEFSQSGVVSTMSHRDAAKAAFPATLAEQVPVRTVQWAKLSAPPKRLEATVPSVSAQKMEGTVIVSYVIDTDGRVRVPVVVRATEPQLGRAALDAVKRWRFAPPKDENGPVLVEDSRSFTFTLRASN